jgi:dihydroorotase
LRLVDEKVISLSRLVELLAVNPAKLAGIPAGTLKPGSAADFMLSDPEGEHELTSGDLHSKSKNSPFAGRRLKGRVLATYVGGVRKWAM